MPFQISDLKEHNFNIATILTERKSYIDSAYDGLSVKEFGDMKAAAEIYPLVQIVKDLK